tara:strand:- start:62 stop:754 length:693 start_codon:yes stop_codon:yes gene_type:complete
MLRLETSQIPFSRREIEKHASVGALYKRNISAVRYRLRNISFVLIGLGLPTLKAYTPASQVGKNVRSRIETLLDEYSSELNTIRALRSSAAKYIVSSQDTLKKLESLENTLRQFLENNEIGIGHNNPPDTVHISKEELNTAIGSTADLRRSLQSQDLQRKQFTEKARPLVLLGQKIAQWLGQRFTEFSQEASKSAGKTTGALGVTAFGLSVSDLGTQIIDTLRAVFNYLF